jgi:hypothetical protein
LRRGPIGLRPQTHFSPDLERFAAYVVVGTLFRLSYPRHHLWLIGALLTATAGVLEIGQSFVPSRDPHLSDFLFKASGVAMGLVTSRVVHLRRAPGGDRRAQGKAHRGKLFGFYPLHCTHFLSPAVIGGINHPVNGATAMFKGKADLIDPETKRVAATFNETQCDDGTTRATVRLAKPIMLEGTQRLEVFGTVTDQPMISVGASDPDGTEIQEFHGTSAIGPIANHAGVSLVRTPGGKLRTLLVVIGNGTVHQVH